MSCDREREREWIRTPIPPTITTHVQQQKASTSPKSTQTSPKGGGTKKQRKIARRHFRLQSPTFWIGRHTSAYPLSHSSRPCRLILAHVSTRGELTHKLSPTSRSGFASLPARDTYQGLQLELQRDYRVAGFVSRPLQRVGEAAFYTFCANGRHQQCLVKTRVESLSR